jgi:uncharacterized repeat protein (TIGR02543 family)
MKKKRFSVLFTLVLVLSLSLFQLWPMASPVRAATITSTATGGAWTTPATWSSGTVPLATDSVVIATIGAGTVTTGGNRTCAGLTINSGANLTMANGNVLTVNGNVSGTGTWTMPTGGGNSVTVNFTGDWSFSGTLTAANRMSPVANGSGDQTVTGTVTFRNFTINKSGGTIFLTVTPTISNTFTMTAGNVSYNGVAQTVLSATYPANLTLAGSGTKTLTGATTVGGNLDVGSGTTFTVAGYNITVTGTTSVSGTLIHSSTTGTKIFTGLVTINSGGVWNNSANEAITFRGGLTHNGTTFTAGSGIQTFTINSQAIGGTSPISIPSVTVTGVNLTNNGTLTVTAALAGTGALINSATGILNINFTGAVGINTLTATAVGNTVNYGFAGNQTVRAVTYHHLTLSGSGTKTLGGVVTVNGNLTIGSGTTLDVSTSNYSLTVKGNWSNGGAFTQRSGTVTLNGTGVQTMTGATTFYNLTLDNSSGLTLNNNATISNMLTLTNGKITTGSNTVIIGSSGSVSRTNGYVVGNLQKNVATGSTVSRTFEVGTASAYNPVTVTFANVTVAGNLTAKATSGDHPSIGTSWLDPSKSVNAYWSLTNSGISFNNYNATFTFTAGDIDSGASFANFIIGKFNNPTWTYPTVGTRTSTSTQATGMTSFGEFAVADELTYTLTVNIVGNGGVTKNPNQATYHYNDVVQLTATANEPCSPFSGWSGDLNSTNNPDNITMTGNKTVTATFTAITPPDCTIEAPSSVYANSIGNTASVTEAGGGATYTWTINNGGTITAGQGTRSITWRAGTLSPVTIGVTVNISGCQCTDSVQVTVTTPSALSVDIAGFDNFCPGGSTTLTANAAGGAPPYTYLWSTGATDQSIEVTIPDTYSVTVSDSAACSSTIVSDTDTLVTRGNGTVPHNAVLAWVHGNWWPGLTGYNFGYPTNTAQWIWETYQVVHPVEGDVVFFERSFDIPGTPIGATLHITCDNGFEAYINDNYLGWANLTDYGGTPWEDSNLTDNWVAQDGWEAVQTYNIPATSLRQVGNILVIQAANEQVTGGTATGNPGAIIYDLIYEYNCTASDSVDVTLNPTPTADFTAVPLSGSAPLSVQFTDTSTDANSWNWSFPDGSPSSWLGQVPPQVIYNNPGSYDVTLIVTNSYGCSDEEIKPGYITVGQPPTTPTVNFIQIYDSPDLSNPVSLSNPMTPLATYYAKMTITTSGEQLSGLQTVQVTLFYVSDNSTPAPGPADPQTCAILSRTVGGTISDWTIDSGSPTMWAIMPDSCSEPTDLNFNTGDWIFAFIPGRVATETTGPAHWDAQGKATNKSSLSGENYVRNKAMNWYGEISDITPSVNWGEVPLGLKFGDIPPQTVSIKYIANGDYYENIMSEDWSGSGETVILSTGDPPALSGSFALKANDTSDLGTAIDVTGSYNAINDTGIQTTEDGVTVATNSLWLSLSQTGIAPVFYSGTIYYQIAKR